MPSCPSWLDMLDRGTIINVGAPGCGTSVVRGLTGHKCEGFLSWGKVVPNRFLGESAYFSSCISHSTVS